MKHGSLLDVAYRRTPQVQARLDAQRAAILTAASDLLIEHGFRGATVTAVAERAGVAAGTVYAHFAGKSELFAELFRTIVSGEVAAVRAAAAPPAPAVARVVAVLDTFATRALKHPRRAYALLAEPVDPAIDALRRQYRHGYRDVIAAAIADGVATGELPPQNPAVVAAALCGAMGEALVGPLETGDPDTVPTLVRFIQRALGADRAHHP